MTLSIDDLVKVYERHGIKVSVPDLIEVVEALAPNDDEIAAYNRLTHRVRKEMPCECEYLPEDRCISCEVADALCSLESRYHEILASGETKE